MATTPSYRLVRPPVVPVAAPELDPSQQQVVTQMGRGHALDLAHGRAGEAVVPGLGLHARQRGALVGLHMGAQPVAGQGRGHGGEVVLEGVSVDEQGGCLQLAGPHGGSLA